MAERQAPGQGSGPEQPDVTGAGARSGQENGERLEELQRQRRKLQEDVYEKSRVGQTDTEKRSFGTTPGEFKPGE